MSEESDYGLIWLESWLVCCDNSLANFLLCSEFGSDQDSRSFLAQFKRAKQSAVQNMKDRKMNHCDRATLRSRKIDPAIAANQNQYQVVERLSERWV